MIRKSLMAALLLIFAAAVSAQKPADRFASPKKGSLIGLHFNMIDFTTPKVIKATSLNNALKGDSWKRLSNYGYGFSAAYWKGITSKIDFTMKGNLSFYDYSSIIYNVPGRTEVGFELEPSVSVRPFSDNHLVNPFLTAGLGAGIYTGNIGLYAPLGMGVQFNFNSVTYLFIQSQYHATITSKAPGSNLFYSIGFAENITEPKAPPVVVAPPLPVKKDRDNDGIDDDKDACPDAAGSAALNGCPDKDKDGIADKDDKCPDVAGTARYSGCPVPDTDGDGVNDESDKCPATPGSARYQGCPVPDTDGDGINDDEDKCPTEVGVLINAGCPEVKKDVVDQINIAAKNILFSTGSAKIQAKSFAALNSIAKVLTENPSYQATIEGHTDNTGDPERNKTLSEARAQAVVAYLKARGIADNRLSARGFGQEVEVVSNKTAAGRAQNRRVEIKVNN